MILSDLYIFSLPSISACHGQVAGHIRVLIVGCVIWPKYTVGFPREAIYQAARNYCAKILIRS